MPLTLIQVDGTDPAALDAICQVMEQVRKFDLPKWRENTRRMIELMIEVPWPAVEHQFYVAWHDGQPVGRVAVNMPTGDNLDTLFVDIWVVPSARRQGFGRELFEWVRAFARTKDRKKLIGTTLWELDGIPAPNLAGAAFAESLGAKGVLADVTRRLDLSTVDDLALAEMLSQAREKSAGYRVVRWIGTLPEELVDDLA